MSKKLPKEYYESSKKKNRKRFFDKLLPKMKKELGLESKDAEH